MKITDIGRHTLKFDESAFRVSCPRKTSRFSGLATSALPKLYVASVAERPIYVGVTKQSIGKRLRFGWRAKGEDGYYGYAWRRGLTEANLDIWCHENPRNEAKPCIDIETIEAEVVYLIRKSGQWPEFQTEIHFHQSNAAHRSAAEMIAGRYGIAP